MEVPFLDLKKQYRSIHSQVHSAMDEVMAKTAFAGGPFVESFEERFAKFCHTEHCVGLNSGTSALHLAMLALGIGPGDEVILPANTFIATAWGVSYVGATPVFVDCEQDYWNIDVAQVEAKITSKTKAIIGVHLYGQPCDIGALQTLAEKHGIYFVEDAAQAHGATYNGEVIGGFGEMACFSFYPGKNLGAYGEGGAITTNNEDYVKHLHRLRNHGCDKRYYHDIVGYNMRMDGLQGAILEVKLQYINSWNKKRNMVADAYNAGITNPAIQKPVLKEFATSAYHLYVVTTEHREALRGHLNALGVSTGLHYPVPCHLQKAYADLGYKEGEMPVSEALAKNCLSLPIYAELEQNQIDFVIQSVNDFNP